jgi:ureidoglycolate lyase
MSALDPPKTSGPLRWLEPTPLTSRGFAPFGSVIEAVGGSETINDGTSQKYANLSRVELDAGAQAALHLYRTEGTPLPCSLRLLERHPLASQAFIPRGAARFLVVVGPGAESPRPEDLVAFITNGHQGIQLATGIWHHPLLSLDAGEYLIVDRYCADPEESARNLHLLDISEWGLGIDQPLPSS